MHGYYRRSEYTSANVSKIHRQLRCHRTRREVRKRKPASVFFFGEPTALEDEIAVHISNECYRAAKADRTEPEKIEGEPAKGEYLRSPIMHSTSRDRRDPCILQDAGEKPS